MRIAKGVMLALLLGFGVAAVGDAQEKQEQTQPAGGEPSAMIEQTRYEFGEIYEQKSYKHTFKIKNSGTGELRIDQVKPG